MRVTKIEQGGLIFVVTLTPNLIQRWFGLIERKVKYKSSDSSFMFGGGGIYIKENGDRTSNGDYVSEQIDKFRRKF